jgi:D-alanine--D-alanine ligase
MKTRKIAVLMGGPSTEREVSFNTGRAILQALQEKGYNAVGIDLEPEHFVDQLRAENIDIVFNAIHGKYGEDGALQGALELLGIPYTGSGVLASAIAMDKAISKRLFIAAGIPTPRSAIYTKLEAGPDLPQRVLTDFGLPVVVKATAQGSSIGVVIVNHDRELPGAIVEAFKYSDQILVEEFIKGKEVTAAVISGQTPMALPIIEIVPHSGKYDYHSKYTKGATEYIVPARLDAKTTEKIQELAAKTFTLLGCKGVARVDFMLGADDQPFVLEVNTIPGMTATSLVPKAAAAAGISFGDLCERLLLMTSETAAD